MAIIRWRPLDEAMESLLENLPSNSDLAVDLYDQNDAVIVEMAVAGIDPDKVEISVEDNSLRIAGEREEKEEVEDRNYYRKEIKRGSFERYVALPTAVVPEETRAEFEDGILSIYLPKKKATKASKVKVERK
ncbi:MAG: Hsp20/alpha crystallin family protein [Candidatus Babeliales bacterium]